MKHIKMLINEKILDLLITLIGVIMIGYGLYQIYPPSMWIFYGIIAAFPEIKRKAVR